MSCSDLQRKIEEHKLRKMTYAINQHAALTAVAAVHALEKLVGALQREALSHGDLASMSLCGLERCCKPACGHAG